MELSEDLFIKRIKKLLPAYGSDVVVGVGDDAAVLQSRSDKYLLVTTDVQVEGVHFTRTNFKEICAGEQLGQRAVAAALSDIAAMGGEAKHILVSLVVPKQNVHLGGVEVVASPPSEVVLRHLYEGFAAAGKKYGVDIIGGNISSGPAIIIDIFVLGEVDKKHLVLRSGAKPGDLVLVTGKLGRKAVVPAARLKEGQILAQSGVVTSMIDISDGLSTDLLHICDESAVGVRIFANKLPVASFSSLDMALNGGEDYELCFTTLPASAEKLIAEVQKKTGTKITIIGEILRKNEGRWLINSDGEEKILKAKGWDHLRNF